MAPTHTLGRTGVRTEATRRGASTDPARTLGPNVIGGDLGPLWVYFVGPFAGAILAVGLAYILRGHGGRLTTREVAEGTLGGDGTQTPPPKA